MHNQNKIPQVDWLNPLKAFALLAILFNHIVEEFYSTPLISGRTPFSLSLIKLLGWMGDFGPGVFIIVSGIWPYMVSSQSPRYKF